MKKSILTIAAVFLAASIAPANANSITVKGSDTMVILDQRWAEHFMKANPDITIQVTGGGSGTGLSALINGTTDIAASSRPIKSKEIEQIKKRHKADPKEIIVAQDGLAVYVSDKNPLKSLTIDQLRKIYTGKITNWKELGGADKRIIVYGRENNSGTYVFFKDNVLNGRDFDPRVQTLPGTGAVVNAVAKDVNGIGYGGAAYSSGIRDVAIAADDKSKPMLPNKENIASGAYPLARPLNFYLVGEPNAIEQKFIDYVLSPEGQKIVNEVGYFPIK